MTKKGVLFIAFIFLLINMSLVIAQENTTSNATDTSAGKIDKAYACLKNDVVGKCSSLSTEDKIFSLLAIGECSNELWADSMSVGECWPASPPGCTLKTTAQAILAYDKTPKDTTQAEEWLISRTSSPEDVIWYLQIESSEETRCVITYSSGDYSITLDEDKTINNDAGICLDLTSDEFWLKVDSGCYDEEFEISCDKDFQTSLVFQRKTSAILHVSSQTNSVSANGKSTEKIHSSCFIGSNNKCDYPGSLWAALVLNYKGYDISDYMPYLLTMAEENQEYLPESFLYLLTGQDDYKNTLLLKQQAGKYWEYTGDHFYDTAVALYSITDAVEKTNTKNWLLEIQKSNGCFPTNIKNNAFLLASIWPRQVDPSRSECISSGFFCVPIISCEKADIQTGYTCPGGVAVCCKNEPQLKSCEEQLGNICTSDKVCIGTTIKALDIGLSETCCIGNCQIPAPISDCEENLGTCALSCASGEAESDYDCPGFGDVCCIKGKKGSLWWIWVLIILIILTIVGIIFRKKLRSFFQKGPKPLGPGIGPRPGMPPAMARRPIQRRILPPTQRRAPPKPAEKSSDLSDVLKKLKELGK